MSDISAEELAVAWIRKIIQEELSKLKIPVTMNGRISKILSNNKYEVSIRNKIYSMKSRGGIYVVGNVVDIYCPDGTLTSGLITNKTVTP